MTKGLNTIFISALPTTAHGASGSIWMMLNYGHCALWEGDETQMRCRQQGIELKLLPIPDMCCL